MSGKNTLAAIEGVNLRCEGGQCVITSYDLEKGFRTAIECEIEEEGNYVVNGQRLVQIARSMPGDFVTVDIDETNTVRVSSGKAVMKLHALPGADFPALPDLRGNRSCEISRRFFGEMLDQTNFAIAQNNMRPELNGSFFRTDGKTLTIVACDGNKLALSERSVDLTYATGEQEGENLDEDFILPGKALTELRRLLGDSDDMLQIRMTTKHVIFAVDSFIIFSRIIDLDYIDYDRFIPKQSKIFVTLDSGAFCGALERCLLVSEDRTLGQARSPVKCVFEGNTLKVSSDSVASSSIDEIFTDKVGDDLEIAFNCRFLLEAIRACDVDRIKLSLSGPLMSMIVEPAEPDPDRKFLFLVLPVKIR